MKRLLGFAIILTASVLPALATSPRNLLSGPPELHQLGEDLPGIQAALLPHGAWEPFPRASDRAAWTGLDASTRAGLIAKGEATVDAPWEVLPATTYLDYMRNGDRRSYQIPWAERRNRLIALTLAECAEGKGRFIDQITNGLWVLFEETSWVYPAHIFMQRAGSDLPDATEHVVDLGVGETAALVAWIDYLLGPQLDTVSKMTRKRLSHEVQERILKPCLDRADFWWMAWDTQGHPINNWNPWIVANLLSSALLIEKDPELRARHVEKAQRVLDQFLNSYPADGGCDEGPSYWGRAGASTFEALDWMYGASAGKISIFDEPLIAGMGRYILTAHVADQWYMNFADANARTIVNGPLVYRYGQAIGDPELAAYGVWLWERNKNRDTPSNRSIGRIVPELFLAAELAQQDGANPLPRDGWLPDLQLMTARDQAGSTDGLYVTAKGGHNDESHNHNDVGSFIAYLDGLPLIIDVGPEYYTAKTFSDQRYEIWTMRSAWHNVPLVNGFEQAPGRDFAAQNVHYDAADSHASLTMDLSKTYPPEANIDAWTREIRLIRGDALHISDNYKIAHSIAPQRFHFVTNREVDVSQSGIVRLGAFPGNPTSRGANLTYDARAMDARVTTFEVTDSRLLGIWGERVYRIDLIEKTASLSAKRSIQITPLN
ncbi:MAG: heparinase II/III-family protein [Synoicihabitans sp.]